LCALLRIDEAGQFTLGCLAGEKIERASKTSSFLVWGRRWTARTWRQDIRRATVSELGGPVGAAFRILYGDGDVDHYGWAILCVLEEVRAATAVELARFRRGEAPPA
jgi:hypothetical protein